MKRHPPWPVPFLFFVPFHTLVPLVPLLPFFIQCSSIPETTLYLHGDATTDGHVLFAEFQTDKLNGSYLLGQYAPALPSLLAVELHLRARQDVVLQLDKIRLRRDGVSVNALRPRQIWASYRAQSLASFPFGFRMLLERPAFTAIESPPWIYEQYELDTASPKQRQLRLSAQAMAIDKVYSPATIRKHETRIITLLFPLPVPDTQHPYAIIDETNTLPSLTFYYDTIDNDPTKDSKKAAPRIDNEQKEKSIDEFLRKRKLILQRDLDDLLDEHEQQHEHDELRAMIQKKS